MPASVDLDDLSIYPQADPSGMREHLHRFPSYVTEGWKAGADLSLPAAYGSSRQLLFLGMGGSAVAGELLADLAAREGLSISVSVHRDYGLPSFAGPETLVVACSYSGNTEETLSGFRAALERGCRLLAVTSGGELGRAAREKGVPLLTLGVQAPPRATLPYAFPALLRLLQNLGLFAPKEKDIAELQTVLLDLERGLNESTPARANAAKQLASHVYGHIAVVYGAGLFSAVARRWKTQINENAKGWAFTELLPEANHNALVGYEFPASLAERLLVVFLQERALPPPTLLRIKLTETLLREKGIATAMVAAQGHSPACQLLEMALYGDYVSYYLSILNSVDPTPVTAVDELKRRLAQET
ncbi:MAG: bifunctional phosphoglucose/phosphomannose isomerase [Chloroflexi bacterium]|nr:bifunctional phosphoglucose/phosphomannose isomerase [Chloroflexota bacterium]